MMGAATALSTAAKRDARLAVRMVELMVEMMEEWTSAMLGQHLVVMSAVVLVETRGVSMVAGLVGMKDLI